MFIVKSYQEFGKQCCSLRMNAVDRGQGLRPH